LLGRAGHKVTVLEAAHAISAVGAGIQLTPNMSRLLIRWGLREKLEKSVVLPAMICLRRYANGELLGWVPWGENMEKDHGSPYYHIHRADLYEMLSELASPYIKLRLNSQVIDVDPDAPSVTLKSGEVLNADLIIGADGISSRMREIAFQVTNTALPQGDAAYRAIIHTSEMMKDPELKELVDETALTLWLGPGRHVVGYCIRSKQEYNIVMAHPSENNNETARPADCARMRAEFSEFEPRVRKLLKMVPSTLVWSLTDRHPLKTWVHQSHKVCLLGDSCHPMLPYRAQGAAMAVEDAAVIGNIFSRLSDRSQIASSLQAYQTIRYGRATEAQRESRQNQVIYHLPDGPEQQARDTSMQLAIKVAKRQARGGLAEDCEGNANTWADRPKTFMSFSYDADADVDQFIATHPMEKTKL